ncbi:hypothetical protein HanRHA438_Chr13g0579321 [Helianthus annuus]|nr:hypothetical protein HanRHA438_Chr13g0579321 [Helianthus annuus]
MTYLLFKSIYIINKLDVGHVSSDGATTMDFWRENMGKLIFLHGIRMVTTIPGFLTRVYKLSNKPKSFIRFISRLQTLIPSFSLWRSSPQRLPNTNPSNQPFHLCIFRRFISFHLKEP